jgi:hypothetical protein
MLVAFGIRHACWSMYQGYLTAFCFNENCLSVVIISRVWDVVFILCFCGASGGSTLLTLAFPSINGVTRQLSIICTDMVIPIILVALCALTFGM